MSFILVPRDGDGVQVNAWNWRPTLELLRSEGLIDSETYEQMGAHSCGGGVNDALAYRIADFLEHRLAKMQPGERMRADLSLTDEPKSALVISPETRVEDINANEVYSATYEWLMTFQEFCRRSGGFEVY